MDPVRDHFSAAAAQYASSRPRYPQALADWLAARTRRRSLAWDAGCGSGQLSVPLARAFDRVAASDASRAQVAAASRHPRVHYRVARAEASGLPDAVADLAVSAQAAHWFDLPAYYAEVRRVGRPGSVVALVSYGPPELQGWLDEFVRRLSSDMLGPFWPPERRWVDEGYRSLPFPFDEMAVPAFEMTHRWDLERFRGYVQSWSAVRELERREGPGAVQELFDELRRAWGEPARRHVVRWPLAVRLGTVG